uniref:Chromo domain-containing protein n=1 Tax=Oryza meridionalis TaxID=40149 RepID=A0A0E0E6R8_9ORYZ
MKRTLTVTLPFWLFSTEPPAAATTRCRRTAPTRRRWRRGSPAAAVASPPRPSPPPLPVRLAGSCCCLSTASPSVSVAGEARQQLLLSLHCVPLRLRDRRGHGAAPSPPSPARPWGHLETLAAVIDCGELVEVARSRERKMSEDSPATLPSGLSHIAPLRIPSMEEDEEEDSELLMVDMEMAGEDKLLSLNSGGRGHEGQFYLIIRWRSENDFENAQKAKMAKW